MKVLARKSPILPTNESYAISNCVGVNDSERRRGSCTGLRLHTLCSALRISVNRFADFRESSVEQNVSTKSLGGWPFCFILFVQSHPKLLLLSTWSVSLPLCLFVSQNYNMPAIKKVEYFRVKPRWLMVKITDENGQFGWGEATLEGHDLAVEGCIEEMIPRIIGREAK